MKIAFYTLGCKVNQYETQALKEKFLSRGYEIVGEHDFADVYVVNTCTVTGLADRKSRQYIRRMKRINPECITAVIGCYVQVNPEEVESIEEVDITAGTNEKNKLPDYIDAYIEKRKNNSPIGTGKSVPDSHIKNYEELNTYEETGIITSMESRTRAYIKIQEGCNQFCTYCIIPYARGVVRSRAVDDIAEEAKTLIVKGFKELVLTGINTALYGTENGFVNEPEHEYTINNNCADTDADKAAGIEIVVKRLDELPGDFRIRLGSLEPNVINSEFVKRLLKYKKLCPHMHLSIQSGSDRILGLMNRHYDRDGYMEIVGVLRESDPCYGLTTDIITGFPGETEEDFEDSVKLVNQVCFNKVHVFPYSKRKGTKAADMPGQVDNRIKKLRSKELTEAAEKAAYEFNRLNIGTTRQVLFEEYNEKEKYISGYSDNYIKVYCKASDKLTAEKYLNNFIEIKFTGTYLDGVIGEL